MFDLDVAHITQPGAVLIPFRIDVATGTPVVVEGTRWISVADTDAGIMTVTLSPASARNLVVLCNAVDSAADAKVTAHVYSLDADSFVIETIDESGATVDNQDVQGLIIAFRQADEK